jgi:formate dehydrogenase subunit delta
LSETAGKPDMAMKLAKMANQVGAHFASMGQEAAALATAGHLQKFWTPKMIREIVVQASSNEPGLNPTALAAAKLLQAAQS